MSLLFLADREVRIALQCSPKQSYALKSSLKDDSSLLSKCSATKSEDNYHQFVLRNL